MEGNLSMPQSNIKVVSLGLTAYVMAMDTGFTPSFVFHPFEKLKATPQNQARILTEEVINPKAKRADAQWKKEQKLRRK
jgi:hypothetical protein